MTDSTTDSFRVSRREFRTALRELRGAFGRRIPREVVVSSRQGMLRIEIENAWSDLPIEGGWLGRAVVPGRALFGLASRLPKQDPLEISIRAGILHIGSMWMKLHPDAQPPPLSADERAGLDVKTVRAFYERIEGGAHRKWYQRQIPLPGPDAEYRVMDRVAKAGALLAPLGVKEEDLWRLAVRSAKQLGPRIR